MGFRSRSDSANNDLTVLTAGQRDNESTIADLRAVCSLCLWPGDNKLSLFRTVCLHSRFSISSWHNTFNISTRRSRFGCSEKSLRPRKQHYEMIVPLSTCIKRMRYKFQELWRSDINYTLFGDCNDWCRQ